MFGPVILPLDQAVSAVASADRLVEAGVAAEQQVSMTQVHRFAVGRGSAGTLVLGHSSHSSHASHASHASSSGGGIGWPDPPTAVYPDPVVPIPAAPTGVEGFAGDGSATIVWGAAPAGSSSVTYRVTAFPGGAVRTVVDVTTMRFDGLRNGVAYTFVVTATSSAGQGPASGPSEVVVPVAAQLEGHRPKIVGTPAAGRQLRVETPGWAPGTVLSFRWRVGGEEVAGARGRTFRPTAKMVGKRVVVVVTGTNRGYAAGASAESAATSKVARVGRVSVTGKARVGAVLQAHHGRWVHGTRYRYVWLVGGKRIRHSGPKLPILQSYAGKAVVLRVTGRHDGYASLTVVGRKVGKVSS